MIWPRGRKGHRRVLAMQRLRVTGALARVSPSIPCAAARNGAAGGAAIGASAAGAGMRTRAKRGLVTVSGAGAGVAAISTQPLWAARRAVPRRGNVAMAFVAGSLRNGILRNDTLVTEGLPPARYRLAEAEGQPALADLLTAHGAVDPFKMVRSELRSMSEAIREVIGSDVP